MFQRILVPLDQSPCAEQAIPIAARLARASHGTLFFVQVVGLSYELMLFPPADPRTIQYIIDRELEYASRYLEQVKGMNALIDIQRETAVMMGDPASTLLSFVETTAIDLMVLCRHGKTSFLRWPIGSVARKLAYHSPIPVLMLREGGSLLTEPRPSANGALHALIPLDGSELAQTALEPALHMIEALSPAGRGVLHLTQVVVLPQEERKREAISQQAKAYLQATATHLHEKHAPPAGAAPHFSITWSVTVADDPASGILRAAEDGVHAAGTGIADHSDLIVMTTHGYSGLHRWIMGSVTERVLHVTRLPLLIVPPPEKSM